jgi:hypothetical protein
MLAGVGFFRIVIVIIRFGVSDAAVGLAPALAFTSGEVVREATRFP